MTAQIHEVLILNGEKTSMAFCPPLPYGHPRMVETHADESEQDEANEWIFSTACWRQYLGTWEIKDGRFYLVRIQGTYGLVGDEPLLADWFSGVLRIPRGEEVLYIHMGFGTVFEQELHIKIEKGVVMETRIIDNRGKIILNGKWACAIFPVWRTSFQGMTTCDDIALSTVWAQFAG